MQQLWGIILIIVLLIIVIYAVFQGKLFNLNSLKFPSFQAAPSTSTLASPVSRPKTSSNSSYTSPAPQINPADIPSGFTLRDLSPYFKKFRISASPGYLGSYSQISIYVSSNERVDVTGWSIRGNRGSAYIPQAVDVYESSGFASPSDIYLKNGDVLYIYSTTSGIGVNLRLNKCLGYLSNSNTFNPPLPLNCPSINRSAIQNFTGQCQQYIMSLSSCQMPAPNPPIPITDYACQQFLNNLNYGGCFAAHRSDYDFLSNEWRVWTGSQFLDFQHDRLLLFDRRGLLVDEYNY